MAIVIMKETRSSIILMRLAKKARKATGDDRIRARAEDERGRLINLIYVSCTRPLCELVSENISTRSQLTSSDY